MQSFDAMRFYTLQGNLDHELVQNAKQQLHDIASKLVSFSKALFIDEALLSEFSLTGSDYIQMNKVSAYGPQLDSLFQNLEDLTFQEEVRIL